MHAAWPFLAKAASVCFFFFFFAEAKSFCGVGGVGSVGSDDSGHGVSIQTRAYVQLIKRQQSCCGAESVRDLNLQRQIPGV